MRGGPGDAIPLGPGTGLQAPLEQIIPLKTGEGEPITSLPLLAPMLGDYWLNTEPGFQPVH